MCGESYDRARIVTDRSYRVKSDKEKGGGGAGQTHTQGLKGRQRKCTSH